MGEWEWLCLEPEGVQEFGGGRQLVLLERVNGRSGRQCRQAAGQMVMPLRPMAACEGTGDGFVARRR